MAAEGIYFAHVHVYSHETPSCPAGGAGKEVGAACVCVGALSVCVVCAAADAHTPVVSWVCSVCVCLLGIHLCLAAGWTQGFGCPIRSLNVFCEIFKLAPDSSYDLCLLGVLACSSHLSSNVRRGS